MTTTHDNYSSPCQTARVAHASEGIPSPQTASTEPGANQTPPMAEHESGQDDKNTDNELNNSIVGPGDIIQETRPLTILQDSGLRAETISRFGLRPLIGMGLHYPTAQTDGEAGPFRLKSIMVGHPEYQWMQSELPRPLIYNSSVLADKKRLESGLFLVPNELDVWVMHQNGYAAVSFLDDRVDSDALEVVAEYLSEEGVGKVQIICAETLDGRKKATALFTALREWRIKRDVRVLSGPPHSTISDLFVAQRFDRRKFRDAVASLLTAPLPLVEAWIENPSLNLPVLSPPGGGPNDDPGCELLPCYGEDDLLLIPLPEYLVEGLLLAAGTTLFTGCHNTGKSAIGLDMSACVSAGRAWNGRKTKKGKVVYLAAEGAGGISKRQAAWKRHHSVEKLPDLYVIPRAFELHDPAILEILLRTIQHHCERPALVVIDTLSRYAAGLDENSPNDMAKFVDAAAAIGTATGAAVLIVHHNNRTGEFRGASSLPANCDGHLELKGNPGSPTVKLRVAKIKDFPDGETIALRREVITLSVDDPLNPGSEAMTSVVFVPATGEKAESKLSAKEETVLRALAAIATEGSFDENETTGATSTVWASRAAQDGVPKATFERAKKKLLLLGAIECEAPGKQGALFSIHADWYQSVSPAVSEEKA